MDANALSTKQTKTSNTALANHAAAYNHQFNYEILATANKYQHLRYLEMLYINANENSINKRSDVEHTIKQYDGLITHIKNNKLHF